MNKAVVPVTDVNVLCDSTAEVQRPAELLSAGARTDRITAGSKVNMRREDLVRFVRHGL